MAGVEGDLVYQRAPLGGVLTLVFDVHIHKKYGLLKPEIADLEVFRHSAAKLRDLSDHLENHLATINGDSDQLLFKAICAKPRSRNGQLQNGYHSSLSNGRQSLQSSASSSVSSSSKWKQSVVVPLVCDQIWSSVLLNYPESRLKIIVDQHIPEVDLHNRISCVLPRLPTLNRELKYMDMAHFLPSKHLKASHVMKLCQDIFERGSKIKPELRRGVWMHLVGVFHPDLGSREERERYIEKLRMSYDHLKGKIMGERSDMQDREQLVDAVHRDAIRTDPSNPFFADHRQQEASYISQHYHQSHDEENNIQKLINIIVIYTLEHDNISYTQGMTDILSPILYVMRHEADAYICFAAMVERIKQHFGQWCTGTLHKLDRLRHLCEVLDPKLYQCLTANIEEDPFVLFFGMVLIECRREFSFNDSFHLLETIWAGVACIKNTLPSSSAKSHAEWARYMTYESPEVLQQVFEGTGIPYSAVPLRHTISGSYSTTGAYYPYSRNPSLLSQSPSTTGFLRRQSLEVAGIPELPDSSNSPPATPLGINHIDSSFEARHRTVIAYDDGHRSEMRSPDAPRLRSQSDSNLRSLSSQNTLTVEKSSPTKSISTQVNSQKGGAESGLTHKLGNSSFSHSESELYDSFSNSKIMVRPKIGRNPTEMSDMSSLSSGTASGNLISSIRSMDSRKSGGAKNATPESGNSTSGDGTTRHSESTDGSKLTQRVTSSSDYESTIGTNGRGTRTSTGSDDSSASSDFKDAVDYQSHSSDEGQGAGNGSSGQEAALPNQFPLEEEEGVVFKPQEVIPEVVRRKATPTDEADASAGAGHVTKEAGHVTREEVDGGDTDLVLQIQQNMLDVEVVQERGGRITTNDYKSPLVSRRASNDNSVQSTPRLSPHPVHGHPASDGEVFQRRKRISSPKKIHQLTRASPSHSNESTPVHYGSSNHRVTPVAFFDTMEKLAESAPSKGPLFPSHFTSRRRRHVDRKRNDVESEDGTGTEEEEGEIEGETERTQPSYRQVNRQRTNSDAEISLILSQLVSTEQGAPRVNTEDSLSIPFSDCYSLFVCLSILVQNREDIMSTGADFYQLSTILNTQAAGQNLDRTLKVSRQLCKIYRRYQDMWFGASGAGDYYDRWLDDTGTRGRDDRGVES